MVIDFHTHIFPDRIAHAAVTKLAHAAQIPAHSDGTAAGLLASMERSGITQSVLLPVATNPLKLASMNTAAIAQLDNPKLIPFGAMHPDAPDWKAELQRLSAAGVKGIKIHPVYQGVDLDDIRFLRILDSAAELGMITVMHAGDDIGFPGVVHCSPEMVRRAVSQLGNIPLVLAHMGGWKNWERVADNLADTGVYLDTSFSLGEVATMNPEIQLPLLCPEDFCALVRAFGADHILFGTDSPWTDQSESLATLRALPLSAQELRAIEYQNAKRLLRLN